MGIKIIILDDKRPSTNDLINELRASGKEVLVAQSTTEMTELIKKSGEKKCRAGCGNIPIDLIQEIILRVEKHYTSGYVEVARIGKAADYPNYDDQA